ncbi:MAG: uncharacterized protein A8A55_0838 [Amphiamblys sp. WSBS2006]|nr:MAG: uncharacterized protein A8A55_0838 [Amphiamblys sp. WSBS2006]
METIFFRSNGLSALSNITNKKINVRHMAVINTMNCFSKKEKKEIKRKEFVIREKLHMRNTGIFFMELLGGTVFIPVIEIEVDCFMATLGRLEKIAGVHVETNALLENIKTQTEDVGCIEETIKQAI